MAAICISTTKPAVMAIKLVWLTMLTNPRIRPRKVTAQPQARPTLDERFRQTDVSKVMKESEMFSDKEFCIVNGSPTHPKAELEKMVAGHGGSIVQHPGNSTFVVIADRINLKIKNIITKGKYDVAKVDLLLDVLVEHVVFLKLFCWSIDVPNLFLYQSAY